MAGLRPGTPDQTAFLDELVRSGRLIGMGVPGLYGHDAVFGDILAAVDRLVTQAGAGDNPERLRFPPLLPRRHLETSGYLTSFPHLAGTVFAFAGDEAKAVVQADRASRHEDWSEFQAATDLVLTPAACYPAYPVIADRGPLPAGGTTLDLGGAWVFRHEPSGDPARMQTFHQREMVRLGEPEAVAAWRDAWRDRSVAVLATLGLDARVDVATDPFFGRGGRMLAVNQRKQELKFEVLVPIAGPSPTAVASFNYHQTHFAEPYGITTHRGDLAHTACLGFGLERITLALIKAHGTHPADWPSATQETLWP